MTNLPNPYIAWKEWQYFSGYVQVDDAMKKKTGGDESSSS